MAAYIFLSLRPPEREYLQFVQLSLWSLLSNRLPVAVCGGAFYLRALSAFAVAPWASAKPGARSSNPKKVPLTDCSRAGLPLVLSLGPQACEEEGKSRRGSWPLVSCSTPCALRDPWAPLCVWALSLSTWCVSHVLGVTTPHPLPNL